MKEVLKRRRVEIAIIGVLLIILIAFAASFAFYRPTTNLSATIYKRDEILLELDLTKEEEERTFYLENIDGEMLIGVKKNAIAVLKCDCPHQDCVHQGYVTTANVPIICAHYAITIVLTSNDSETDVMVG